MIRNHDFLKSIFSNLLFIVISNGLVSRRLGITIFQNRSFPSSYLSRFLRNSKISRFMVGVFSRHMTHDWGERRSEKEKPRQRKGMYTVYTLYTLYTGGGGGLQLPHNRNNRNNRNNSSEIPGSHLHGFSVLG